MSLLVPIRVDEALVKADQLLVDTNSVFLPSYGTSGMWRDAIPIEVRKAIEQDRFGVMFIDDLAARMQSLDDLLRARADESRVLIVAGQEVELYAMAINVTDAYSTFQAEFGYCRPLHDLFRQQADLFKYLAKHGVEREPDMRYNEIERATRRVNNGLHHRKNAPWKKSGIVQRVDDVDLRMVAEFVYENLDGVRTALVSRDSSVRYLARSAEDIGADYAKDDTAARMFDELFWFSFYYPSTEAFRTSMTERHFVVDEKRTPPFPSVYDETGNPVIPASVAMYRQPKRRRQALVS